MVHDDTRLPMIDGWSLMPVCAGPGEAGASPPEAEAGVRGGGVPPRPLLPPRDGFTAGGTVQRLGRRFSRRPATATATAAATTPPAPKEQ
jgi:hypothetical protein